MVRNEIIRYFGNDPSKLVIALRIAECESSFNACAYNPSGAAGVYQFMPNTWQSNYGNVWDVGDQIKAFDALYFEKGETWRWVCK